MIVTGCGVEALLVNVPIASVAVELSLAELMPPM